MNVAKLESTKEKTYKCYIVISVNPHNFHIKNGQGLIDSALGRLGYVSNF